MLSVLSCANNKHARNFTDIVDESAVAFIKQGLEAGQTEIKASKIAETTSKNSRVISFAQMVIADHINIDDNLQKMAITNKVAATDSVSGAHQAAIASMSNNSGLKFDQAYIRLMIDDHEQAIKLFNIAKTDRNEDIQRFAKRTLPVLMMHLDSANAIFQSLK